MASVSISFDNIPEVVAKLKKLQTTAQKTRVLKSIFRESSKPLVAAARANVPNKTGNLKKSIKFFTTRSKTTFYVGPRAGRRQKNDGFYGRWLEFGTKYIAAKPFMQPAIKQAGGLVKARVSKHVQKKLQAV